MPANQSHKNRIKGLDERSTYRRYHGDGYTYDEKGLGFEASNFTDFKKRGMIEDMNKPGMQGPPVPTNIAVKQYLSKDRSKEPKKGQWKKVAPSPPLNFTKRTASTPAYKPGK